MTLADYLRTHGMAEVEFARLIDVEPSTVNRWVRGGRRPNSALMAVIRQATSGAVQPNDFFPAAPAEAEPLASERAA